MLEVKDLTVSYGSAKILDNVSFSVEAGQWLMIAGPNGAGKSTIVKAISQGAEYTGSITFEGKDVKKYRPTHLGKCFGVLSQNHSVSYSFTVGEIVNLGRYSYSKGLLSGSAKDDPQKIERALELTGMAPLRDQSVLTLSGGELQRAFLAQLFAQDPRLLILDEPTNHLDLIYQKQIFALIQDWLAEGDRAVISVVHDLSLARAYGTHALLMEKGHVHAYGGNKDVLCRKNLTDVYDMDVYAWMNTMLSQWSEEE